MAGQKAGGKKLRRSRPHTTPPEKRKVKKGSLHKKNGANAVTIGTRGEVHYTHPFMFKPDPSLVAYYQRMKNSARFEVT